MDVRYLQTVLKKAGLYTGRVDGDYGRGTKKGVRKLQTKLKELNLYPGRLDGDYGPMTKRAVSHFQRLHPPLVVDGIIGKYTMGLLFHDDMEDRVTLEKSHEVKISPASGRKYPHESRCMQYYGKVGKNQTKITLPFTMKLAWAPSYKLKKITCHKYVAEDLQGIYEDAFNHYGQEGIEAIGLDMFGGSLNVRKIRGGNRWSTHSWGIATDNDPGRNQLRWHAPKARLSAKDAEPFFKIVEGHGATSLGRLRNYDWMHIQFAHR